MTRYWLHALAVVIAVALIAGACVVRTTPVHQGSHHQHQKHKKHKKHKHGHDHHDHDGDHDGDHDD